MKKLTRTVATLLATLFLSVVVAGAAQAYTVTHYYQWLGGGKCAAIKVVDYNWWEETFQGKRDYEYVWYYYNCNFGL